MSELHRRNVAALPCAECGIEGYSQAAHSNSPEYGKGRGMKASDAATFPLCCDRLGILGCHTKHDRFIGITKAEAREREHRYIAMTVVTLFNLGKLTPKK